MHEFLMSETLLAVLFFATCFGVLVLIIMLPFVAKAYGDYIYAKTFLEEMNRNKK